MILLPRGIGFRKVLICGGMAWLLCSCAASPPTGLGLIDGRLAPCPSRPNCVCSEDVAGESRIDPLRFPPASRDSVWVGAQEAVKDLGGTIEKATDDYLWATFRSRVFGFVDDLELRLIPERGLIQVRLASRLGYSDFGVNRQRVEALRHRLAEYPRHSVEP